MSAKYTTMFLFVGLMGVSILGLSSAVAQRVDADFQAEGRADIQTEALTRGPVHEAFAAPYNQDAVPGMIVSHRPPSAVNEVPPDVAPQGNDILWVPGYWAWDDEQQSYFWISGVWRKAPPGHRWVPGYWAEVPDGFQWVSGFWASADADRIAYVPDPPRSRERGPTSRQPSMNHFWMPGVWWYYEGQFAWRDGAWIEADPRWVWIPDRYVWTPHGCLFAAGYWDFPLHARGVLFAPVAFHGPPRAFAHVRYTPGVVIDINVVRLHLFVNLAHCHYYFGDYYGRDFSHHGYHPWHAHHDVRYGHDPLLAWSQVIYARRGVDFVARMQSWNQFFVAHEDLRPRHTFTAQAEFAARHQDEEHTSQVAFSQRLDEFAGRHAERLQRLTDDRRSEFHELAGRLGQLTEQRTQVEARAEARADPTTRQRDRVLELPEILQPAEAERPESRPQGRQRPQRPERSERPERPPVSEQPEEPPHRPERPEVPERPIRPETPDRGPEVQRPERPPQQPELPDRPELPQRPDTPARPREVERPERPPQRPELPDRPEQRERRERQQAPDRRQTDERPAPPSQRLQRPDRPQRPERPDLPERVPRVIERPKLTEPAPAVERPDRPPELPNRPAQLPQGRIVPKSLRVPEPSERLPDAGVLPLNP